MQRYDNLFLPVDNLALAREFYTGLGLGIHRDFSDKGMIAFSVGAEEPAIIVKDVHRFPDTKATIWFVVDAVDRECQRLEARGIPRLSEPFAIQTGHAVEFEDPFGNRLGMADYLSSSMRLNR